MSGNIVTKIETKVNRLEDMPILVVLPTRTYWLDMSEPIPFQGEPCYNGASWGGSADEYGLEARG